ncbi:hypothetical protein ACFLS8_04165 [Chloroflexota bacterium]
MIEISKDFEEPILMQITDKQLNAADPEVIERWGVEPSLLCLSANDVSNSLMECTVTILRAKHPEDYIEQYKVLNDEILNSKGVNQLVNLYGNLHQIHFSIRTQLEESLLRRDYILRTCRLCPG